MKIAIIAFDNREDWNRFSDPYPIFGPAPDALFEGLSRQKSCEIHVLSCAQRPLASPAALKNNIRFHLEIVGKWGWLRGGYAGCIRALRRKLRQIQPDIVHGQGTERYCAMAAAYSGYPNVVTVHGNMRRIARFAQARPLSFLWITAKLEPLALRRTSGVFCNSKHTEQQVSSLAPRVWRVPNALRSEFFSSRPDDSPGSPPLLLNIGSILPNKSQLELLDLGARLKKRGANFHLKFVGALDTNTPYGSAFATALKEAEKQGWASYSDYLTIEKLIPLLDSASALIHAPEEEAFGLVVAEALARNLKLFCTDSGGPADIAAGIESAVLIPRKDLAAWETAIFDWLAAGHPKPLRAAQAMAERYHPDIVARRHIEIYREVLANR
jgi:glycosyltransferase involved in cell wall biosynthesis